MVALRHSVTSDIVRNFIQPILLVIVRLEQLWTSSRALFFIRLITLPQELGHQQWSLMVSVIPCYVSLIKTCRNDNSLGISLCFSIVFNHSNNWLEIRNGKHSYSVIRYEWDVFMGKRYSQTCWKVPCYILYHVISIRNYYYYYLGWVKCHVIFYIVLYQ